MTNTLELKSSEKEVSKYYTPSIEDIRVGYECENLIDILTPNTVGKEWRKLIVFKDILRYAISWVGIELIRTPYLTKEQIEQEGWKYKGRSIDIWFEKEGEFERTSWTSYKAILHYNIQDHWLSIELQDVGNKERIFHGKCPSINEFRYICKLIGI